MNAYAQYNTTEALPMPLTDVNQSGYDWHKHPHTKILLNARIRTLKPAHKGMLWMLMEYAALEVPFGSLENDAERLAEMAGVSLSAWSKSSDVVMGAAFVLCSDNRWYCQLLTDMLSSNVQQTDQDEPKQRSKSAERVARMRDRKRNAVTPDVTPVTHDVIPPSVTCNADVTPVTVTSVTNGGIKGGDLELDQEIKKTHTNAGASEFLPDLEQLNTKLKMAGAQAITQKQLDQTLVTFAPHYETQVLTDNQRVGKLVTWIKGDQDKAKRPSSKPVTKSAGDVNSKWNVGKPQPLSTEALAEMEALQRRFAEDDC